MLVLSVTPFSHKIRRTLIYGKLWLYIWIYILLSVIFPHTSKDSGSLPFFFYRNIFFLFFVLCIFSKFANKRLDPFIFYTTLPSAAKYFPHIGQIKGFSPVWILLCDLNPDKVVKYIPQRQEKTLCPVWCLLCNNRESGE